MSIDMERPVLKNHRPVCVYHRADLDGVCSGAIVNKFVPGCTMVGYDYGDPFPWHLFEEGDSRTCYMVDVSLPKADMEKLAGLSELVWIDHHKTAIDELVSVGMRARHTAVGMAACALCWTFFTGGDSLPQAVQWLSRYDVWDRSDPVAWEMLILPFQYGARSLTDIYNPLTPVWEDMFSDDAEGDYRVVRVGAAILGFQEQQCLKIARDGAYEREFCNVAREVVLRGVFLNTPINNSQSFDGVYDPSKHDIMVAYSWKKDRWRVSLYTTKDEVQCGIIAKWFGGGGHQKAAGFECDKLPWALPTREVEVAK